MNGDVSQEMTAIEKEGLGTTKVFRLSKHFGTTDAFV